MGKLNPVAKHTEDFYWDKFEDFLEKGGNAEDMGYRDENDNIDLEKFASDYDAYSRERSGGGNRGHESITSQMAYWSNYSTSKGDASRRKSELEDLISENEDKLTKEEKANLRNITKETIKKHDSKWWADQLRANGIDPLQVYNNAKAKGMTAAQAKAYVSQHLFGSK